MASCCQPWLSFPALPPVFFAGREKPKDPVSSAASAWQFVKDTNNPAALRAFARRYKGTVFADMALAVGSLGKSQPKSSRHQGHP